MSDKDLKEFDLNVMDEIDVYLNKILNLLSMQEGRLHDINYSAEVHRRRIREALIGIRRANRAHVEARHIIKQKVVKP